MSEFKNTKISIGVLATILVGAIPVYQFVSPHLVFASDLKDVMDEHEGEHTEKLESLSQQVEANSKMGQKVLRGVYRLERNTLMAQIAELEHKHEATPEEWTAADAQMMVALRNDLRDVEEEMGLRN